LKGGKLVYSPLKRGEGGILSVSKSVTQIKMENEPSQKFNESNWDTACHVPTIIFTTDV
jgi:hypothetical protein